MTRSEGSTSRHVAPPTEHDVHTARVAVRGVLWPTPLLPARLLHPGAWIKVESMLPTGSFKPRGAAAALSTLPARKRLVVSSAGNAAIAMAWAASRLGRRVTIVIPESASPAKLAKLSRFAATIERRGSSFDEAEAWALDLAARDAEVHYLSSYNDPALIAGFSTIGYELADLEGPLTVIIPVGGGGLISGVCTWAATRPDVTIVGAQASASPAMSAALSAGRIVEVPVAPTLAEGLAGNIEAGAVTFDIVRRRVDRLVDADEDEIGEAMRFLAFEYGLIAEGAGAVATAAVLFGKVRPSGTTVVILSGSNISSELLMKVLSQDYPGPRLGRRVRSRIRGP